MATDDKDYYRVACIEQLQQELALYQGMAEWSTKGQPTSSEGSAAVQYAKRDQ